MPLIRIGYLHPTSRAIANKKGKLSVPKGKIPRAKIKGVQVGHGNTGKETAHTVQKRMADPNKPIAPNHHPAPPTTTRSKHIAAGGTQATWSQHLKTMTPNPKHDAYHNALKNDPNFHKATAAAMNHERMTRMREKRRHNA